MVFGKKSKIADTENCPEDQGASTEGSTSSPEPSFGQKYAGNPTGSVRGLWGLYDYKPVVLNEPRSEQAEKFISHQMGQTLRTSCSKEPYMQTSWECDKEKKMFLQGSLFDINSSITRGLPIALYSAENSLIPFPEYYMKALSQTIDILVLYFFSIVTYIPMLFLHFISRITGALTYYLTSVPMEITREYIIKPTLQFIYSIVYPLLALLIGLLRPIFQLIHDLFMATIGRLFNTMFSIDALKEYAYAQAELELSSRSPV